MNGDDDNNQLNNNDYGNEDFDGNMNDGMGNDGMDNNGMDGAVDGGDDPDVDQYFDDAGDIGYLPADHVTFNSLLINNIIIASHAKTPKCFD